MQKPTIDLTPGRPAPPRSSAMPDIADALPWRTWIDAIAEAGERRAPILALAEPAWTNSAQRIALRLREDENLREGITAHVIPALVPPGLRPDLVARWRRAAVHLTGTAGPPLLMLLTHEGDPFLAYPTMAIEGDKAFPSLASLLASVAEAYAADPGPFLQDAAAIIAAPDPALPDQDPEHGGLDELPHHPRPLSLWAALDARDAGSLAPEGEAWLRTTLRNLASGGLYDHLDRGFFRCAREASWVVPHFEKPVPLNAALAAVYARAGRLLDEPTWSDLAARTASFCLAALADGVDAIGADSPYYTWTSKEFRDNLEPTLLQVAALHFGVMPVDLRQSLRRAVEIANLDRYSHEDPDILRTRLMRARTQLRTVRQRRPAPELVTVEGFAWRAETIRWLLLASEHLEKLDRGPVLGALGALSADRFREGHGYARDSGEAWLEDQAALLAAFATTARVTGDPEWNSRALDLAAAVERAWRLPGGWRDRPDSDTLSAHVIDDMLPAAIPTLEAALADVARLPGS